MSEKRRFPGIAIYAHRLTERGRPANEMINWSFLSFPARFTDARSAHFSPLVSPTGIEHPGRSGRFALQRIVHVGPGRTLHTDYPGVIAGTKGLHANRTAGRSLPRRRGVEGRRRGTAKVRRSNAIDF